MVGKESFKDFRIKPVWLRMKWPEKRDRDTKSNRRKETKLESSKELCEYFVLSERDNLIIVVNNQKFQNKNCIINTVFIIKDIEVIFDINHLTYNVLDWVQRKKNNLQVRLAQSETEHVLTYE